MRVRQLELRRVALDLVTPFRASHGTESRRDVLLLRLSSDVGDGWAECVAMTEPSYAADFVDAAELVIERFLWPTLATAGELDAADVAHLLTWVKGHPMAKAAIETAVLDAELRAAGRSLRDHLGGTRARVPSGVSVGIVDDVDELLTEVQGYVDDGYLRIKLKIEPGRDLEPVRLVRELIGSEIGLQVDANGAYERTDIEHLCRLDDFDLLLVEQPLPEDDLLGHAQLAAATSTPVCLDESIGSLEAAADAIELGAAEVVNLKPGRVGGYLEARRIHDLCLDRGVPVWCGGMLETGIGRAGNIALAALPGFTLPGDISASSRYYARDLVREPVGVVDGHVEVPTGAGLGVELDLDYIDEVTTATRVLDG